MSRLPVENLPARLVPLDLAGTEVHHLPDWKGYADPKRLEIIRHIAMMRGRDPRIASLAVDIIKKAGVQPRDYHGQAAALLAWVQDPKNIYYVNEPGERLQDPIFTIKNGFADCFAEDSLLLRDDMQLVPIQSIRVGDRIWGKDRWSTVGNWAEKGKLPVTAIKLNNGSVLNLTEDHKVYVRSCEKHGPLCPDIVKVRSNCAHREFQEVRLTVAELQPGMELLQPREITRPARPEKVEEEGNLSWFIGAFIAEGWAEKSRISVSGQDGNWKEDTKHRVQTIAKSRGWATYWHRKYISVNDPEAVQLVADCGSGAKEKRIPDSVLLSADLKALDEGLQLDASRNSRGDGWTFGTISRTLAVQYRVLQRMLGRSTSWRVVHDHGGFGTNSIYRVGVRVPGPMRDKRLRVQSIERGAREAPCYDIATDDHYVYLPEADCTVSNCDDQVLVLTALFESIHLPWKLVLAGTRPTGKKNAEGQEIRKKVRYIEGSKNFPTDGKWAHIYCMVGTPAFNPKQWYFCETTINKVPLGWDVVDGDKSYLPELDTAPPGPARLMRPSKAPARFRPAPLPAPERRSPAYALAYNQFQPSEASVYGQSALSPIGAAVGASLASDMEDSNKPWLDFKKIVPAIVTGITVSVGTQLLLDWVRPRLGIRRPA